MGCNTCRHLYQVQWGRKYRMACLEGIYIPRDWEQPIDGERLALLLGFGMGRVFDKPMERCRKYKER